MARTLLAVLGVGKGTWGHVARLISEETWEQVLLISNEWGKENFAPSKEADWIIINNRSGFELIKDEIKKNLPDNEIVVTLISGSGKEHMAILAALKEKKVDFKIVILTGEGTKYY
ncbi:MAG: hypothetical protein COV47_04360 [Candidatus Diapherotrites archaeon CG11_big_fil_rev_8_21_14_0_20_37_9]|nr:MAG: hypothetical protein COV47_04360 [Candidatus Diapherotrites archaeon CG11_big_fil_rev_8_21_14_0_20_37_9]